MPEKFKAEKFKVIFPLENKEIEVQPGTTVSQACALAGSPLNLVCGGKGKCGKCKLKIEKNSRQEEVLACQEIITCDLNVFLPEGEEWNSSQILTSNNTHPHATNPHATYPRRLKPLIQKNFLPKAVLQTPSYQGDWEHIQKQAGTKLPAPPLGLLQKLSRIYHQDDLEGITLVSGQNTLLAIEENDTTLHNYGLAVDLGTTSIVAYCYDLNTGQNIGTYSALNNQISVGADVITRIGAALENSEGLALLQAKVVQTINVLIDMAVGANKLNPNSIYALVIAGNSAMQHLFLGFNPQYLGRTPYTNTIQGEINCRAKELGIKINPQGIVTFLPLIAGFVGADTTAVLLSLPEKETAKLKLIIDLGTNGEILVGSKDGWLTTSTAAGPALEGANISCGMRASAGAISKVEITEGKVKLTVIGEEKPKGICGSGLVDAVAAMLKAGLLSKTGLLLSAEKYLAVCRPEHRQLASKLLKINNTNVFLLATEEQAFNGQAIYISQKDIRALQLAKSAIYTGCSLLLKAAGLKENSLDEILLAGAFGNYIDITNAQLIGLIPSWPKVPVRSIGNAAGGGAINYLLSSQTRDQAAAILKKIRHLDLAAQPDFQQEFLANTNFR